MTTEQEKTVIERFIQEYNAKHATAFQVTEWPDDNDQGAIDAVAKDGAVVIAIEHTILQPFSGEKYDSSVFLKTVGKLDMTPHLTLPGITVTLIFEVGAVPTGTDWTKVAPAVEQWYLANRQALPMGHSNHTIPGLQFSLDVAVTKEAIESANGFFFIGRAKPSQKQLDDTIFQALNTKVDKLAAVAADKRILLFENDVPLYDNSEVGQIVDKLLPHFPRLSQVQELWVVNTVALQRENYVAIDLVWPQDSAEKYAQNWARS